MNSTQATDERIAIDAAEADMVADMDTLLDWAWARRADAGWLLRHPERIGAAEPADMLHALLTCAPADLPLFRDALVRSYLAYRRDDIDALVSESLAEMGAAA